MSTRRHGENPIPVSEVFLGAAIAAGGPVSILVIVVTGLCAAAGWLIVRVTRETAPAGNASVAVTA